MDSDNPGCVVITLLIALVMVVVVCPMAFDYSLWTYFGKDIPWYGDVVCGVALNGVIISAALVAWVLVLCDCEVPLIPACR
ncbi:MAG: hypothetical protein HQ581_22390 [Planctomycetes bacterium]|nr:hypothetical protein [Planctomycetota bacterium]